MSRGATGPQNKELKLTKPAQAMELRSLTPVFGGLRPGSAAAKP
jgi:hypothetical protein